VALILDVPGLVAMSRGAGRRMERSTEGVASGQPGALVEAGR
jgi:hypothetical protein